MLISESQIFNSNKSHLTNEKSVRITEALNSGESFDDMFSTIQNTIAETETSIPSELNRCSVETGKTPSTFDNDQALSTANSVENVVSLSDGEKRLDKYDILVLHLANKMAKTSKPDKSFTDLIKNTCSLEDIQKFSNALTYSKQKSCYEQLQTTSFYPISRETMDWNISSNTLAKEIILKNNHFARRRRLQTMEMRMQKSQDWEDKLKNVSKSNFVGQPLVPALDFRNKNRKNQELNLLCVFTNEADCDKASSDFNKIHHDEDIRMILPMTWNIVVASNVLTISDENNQHITIFFRNSLAAKFDYKCSKNLSFGKKFRFYSTMDATNTSKSRAQNDRMRKLSSPRQSSIIAHQVDEPFNWRTNRAEHKSPKQVGEKKITDDSFLLLRKPILLNCIEQNKTKQVLMYKAHSMQNESKNNFCKTLEELLDKSVQYKDEPIYLVFEPLKLIIRLKREEKMRGLNVENYYTCKHEITRSPIYKKILHYKNTQVLSGRQHKNQAFSTILPKNEYANQGRNIREISGESTFAIDSCLDLPKNFSSLFRMKNMDMNRLSMQEASEMPTTPVIATHSCLDLTKNFSNFFSRRNFDMDELFGENKSNFRRRRNTTALKHVNAKKIVSSIFRHFFHFYSLLGGNLRSGAVITRSNSNYWLRVAGVATDSSTLRLAGDLFTTVAG